MTESVLEAPEYTFPDPEPLQFTSDERIEIVETILRLYRREVEQRDTWNDDHEKYDSMHRGVYAARDLPWVGAADLHVQMPFWLTDSISTRRTQAIFDQTPLVGGEAYEDDDQEVFRDAASYVEWSLRQAKAQAMWAQTVKTSCIHGLGVAEIDYVNVKRTYRRAYREGLPEPQMVGGTPQLDDDGKPVITQGTRTEIATETKYQGIVLKPLGWEDVLAPMNGENLQPLTPDNPLGCDYVGVRQMEALSLIWKKREASYPNLLDEENEYSDKAAWVAAAPQQDRSTSGTTGNNFNMSRNQDDYEGRQRSHLSAATPEARPNPEVEVLKWYMPWEVEDEDGNLSEEECIFFVSVTPKVLMGAFRLSDALWTNERPLLELHYHKVPGRLYSMGVMEIGKHLSAELDAIHNMRVDVGFATNLPFFFYRASSAFNPEEIELKPLKGIPVDNIGDVMFPQMQNVTSFYHQEEQLLYSLIERVFGVTDLFLGVSPTQGAASRHATGFVGTQQEALARMSEVIRQDADQFGFLCRTSYNLEMQFGPEERIIRLKGQASPLSKKITREQLRMRGKYDFWLGANNGTFSSMLLQQRAQAVLQLAQASPFINGDPGRRWEAENTYLWSIGETNPERFIGPKDSVAPNQPKEQDEENGEMTQFIYGQGNPAPVNMNDNDQKHLQEMLEYTSSEAYSAMGFPNFPAFTAHAQLHQRQMQQKQQQSQMQSMQAQQGPGQQAPQSVQAGPALAQERINPQLQSVGEQAGGNPQSNGNGMPSLPQGV